MRGMVRQAPLNVVGFGLITQQVAMRLLEKDIHDKQDTLISIRRQLEDVKKLNLELHNKLQVP